MFQLTEEQQRGIANFDTTDPERAAKEFLSNKEKLFNCLQAADISLVIVNYDGGGDEGNIDEIQYLKGGDEAEAPDAKLNYSDDLGKPSPNIDLGDFITRLTFDFIFTIHGGWENGEGAHGTIEFATETQTIQMTHNARVIEYDTSVTDL